MASTLQQLRNENDEYERSLNMQDRNKIDRIMEYLKTYTLPEMEMETVRKDIIGMAAEANARGKTFLDEIGDEKAFSHSVAQGMKGKSRINLILYALTCLFGGLCAISVMKHMGVVLTNNADYFGMADIMYLLAWLTFCLTAAKAFGRKAVFSPQWKRALYMAVCFGAVSVCSSLAKNLFNDGMPLFPVSTTLTIIFGAIGLLLNCIRKNHISKLVRKDSDS